MYSYNKISVYTLALLTFFIIFSYNYKLHAYTSSYISYPSHSSPPNMAYAFSKYHTQPGHYDRNADGRIDLIIADRNGDGKGDYWATDRNFDGKIDDYQYDKNFDGKIDQWEYDLDGDGKIDKIYADSNFDGRADLYGQYNPISNSYTWYGSIPEIKAEEKKLSFPSVKSVKKKIKKGKAGYSE